MEPLQIQLSLLHDLIDVFWKSIEARNGFETCKHYCDTHVLPFLQKIVYLCYLEQEKITDIDYAKLYHAFCQSWEWHFDGEDPWTSMVVFNTVQMWFDLYPAMKEMCCNLCVLAFHMK